MKIRQQFLIFLLLFSILPVCIFGAFTIYRNNQSVEATTQTYLESISDSQITNIENFCEGRREELSVLADYSLVKDALLHNLNDDGLHSRRNYLNDLLHDFKRINPFLISLSLIDREFRVIGSSEPYTPDEISAFKNKDASYHTGVFRIGSIYERETDSGKKRLVPAYIGSFLNGELIGYIAAEIDTSYFDNLRTENQFLEENGNSFFILDNQNALINIGFQTKANTLADLAESKPYLNSLCKAWEDTVPEKTSGSFQYSYLNTRYITYYAKIPYTNWHTLITVNITAQLKSAAAYEALIFFTVVLLALGLFFAQNFITKLLLHPFEEIASTLRQVKEKQDYSLRIHVHSRNEIGSMAQDLNDLLEFIEQEDLQEKAEQHHLQQLAQCDPMTGVKNKKAIEQEILNMVQEADETGEQITIGFVDIDDFREYNSNFGHLVGDCTIQFVSQVLRETMEHGSVGRNGGDEFVFCSLGHTDSFSIAQDMNTMLQRMNEGFYHEEFGTRIPITCSIGIVTGVGNHLDYATLIQQADEAMYKAKNAGKNTFYIMNLDDPQPPASPDLPFLA